MNLNSLCGAVLALDDGIDTFGAGVTLPPIKAAYEYVLAGNGLFIRAEDSRLEAMVPIDPVELHGLANVEPYARLKISKIPGRYLWAVYRNALGYLPNERMFIFEWTQHDYMRDLWHWSCIAPRQEAGPGFIRYADRPAPVVDLHSHGALMPFFSQTDNDDEQGLRFFVVIGYIGFNIQPAIQCRVGVYGHFWPVPAATIFDGRGPFIESFAEAATSSLEIIYEESTN